MPIRKHLTDKTSFGPGAIEAMSKAFEEACVALQVCAGDEKGREIVATRIAERSFTGNAPGAPSRWSRKRSTEWIPVRPKFVVEVSYDHFSGGRFRHGTTVVRWRPDKRPGQCTMKQLKTPGKGIRF
jgi:ATP-dependent DNA ligase